MEKYNNSIDMCVLPLQIGSVMCQGDSGSGFVAGRKDGSFVVLGVNSYSDLGTSVIGPRISAHIDWTNGVIKAKYRCN